MDPNVLDQNVRFIDKHGCCVTKYIKHYKKRVSSNIEILKSELKIETNPTFLSRLKGVWLLDHIKLLQCRKWYITLRYYYRYTLLVRKGSFDISGVLFVTHLQAISKVASRNY